MQAQRKSNMKKSKYILLIIALILSSISKAEVIVLNSGTRIEGEILLQNEEVLIIKKKDGTRYQYPRNEIASILEETTAVTKTEIHTTTLESERKLALKFQVHAGAVHLTHEGWGGQIGADLMIGSKELCGNPIFIGGSIGYRAKILAVKTYSFIPLQVQLAMSLVKKQHPPHINISIGYGFLTDKTEKGGLCIAANGGWSYQFSSNSSLQLGIYAELQQTKINITETINNQEYTSFKANNFVSIGGTVGIKF